MVLNDFHLNIKHRVTGQIGTIKSISNIGDWPILTKFGSYTRYYSPKDLLLISKHTNEDDPYDEEIWGDKWYDVWNDEIIQENLKNKNYSDLKVGNIIKYNVVDYDDDNKIKKRVGEISRIKPFKDKTFNCLITIKVDPEYWGDYEDLIEIRNFNILKDYIIKIWKNREEYNSYRDMKRNFSPEDPYGEEDWDKDDMNEKWNDSKLLSIDPYGEKD